MGLPQKASMNILKSLNEKECSELIIGGSVGLLPTDTIYGLSCSAYDKKAVERIYDIKGRDRGVPVIVLISDISDLNKFRIELNKSTKKMLTNNWPGKISFILPIKSGFEYLTRGAEGLAFRMPDNQDLLNLLGVTGPLISTSANPSGQKPAEDLRQAVEYFGDKLDFYIDSGVLVGSASTLVDLTSNRPVVLRQGETPFRPTYE